MSSATPMPGERTVLDPTGERSEATRELSDRPASLDGLTVGLLDISKARGDVFLDRVEAALGVEGARPMDFTGRPMKGFVDVNDEAMDDDGRRAVLLDLAKAFVGGLPPK